MARVRRVCAHLLILFAFASLSVYTSLTAVGIFHIRAVSHPTVTYGTLSWRNQFVLSQSQGQLQQAFRCTRISGCRAAAFLQGLIAETLDPSKPGSMLGPRWVPGSQSNPSWSCKPARAIQALRGRKQSERKTNQVNILRTRSESPRAPTDDAALHFAAAQTAEPSSPRFSSTQLLHNWPHPFPPRLISHPPWAKVIICSFIKLDNIPCVVRARTQEGRPTVLARSILYYWRIISRMPSSFIKHFWSNVNRLENWDIYEVWAVFMKKSIKYDRGEVR